MARSRYNFDEAKIACFLKEGRGTGRGAAYKPWLTVRDVPSSGRSHRPRGMTTGRIHHLLSDIERDTFLLFDWSEETLDIREQFPLDRELTMRITDQMGVQHPRDRQTRVPLVMTTDFLIDISLNGRVLQLARAVKPAEKLGERRVVEKLEIERRYWAEKNVDWGIVTRQDIPNTLVQNIEFVHAHASVDDLTQPYPGYYTEKAALISREVSSHQRQTLRQFCEAMDTRLTLETGGCLMLVRYLLAAKILVCDMSEPIDDNSGMSHFRLTSASQGRARA